MAQVGRFLEVGAGTTPVGLQAKPPAGVQAAQCVQRLRVVVGSCVFKKLQRPCDVLLKSEWALFGRKGGRLHKIQCGPLKLGKRRGPFRHHDVVRPPRGGRQLGTVQVAAGKVKLFFRRLVPLRLHSNQEGRVQRLAIHQNPECVRAGLGGHSVPEVHRAAVPQPHLRGRHHMPLCSVLEQARICKQRAGARRGTVVDVALPSHRERWACTCGQPSGSQPLNSAVLIPQQRPVVSVAGGGGILRHRLPVHVHLNAGGRRFDAV
mmetsp:Transcript_3005/g.7327  ORF Transcript_3005/g.7327 Transcript_3005/m.7327 type:complete len:263 (-) Transcript_3005:32-820(-)